MRTGLLLLAGASLLAARAEAADKLTTLPTPAWVKAVLLPPAPAKPGTAAVAVLLQDQQVDLQPGRQSRYSETALLLQTAQGLAAGNVTLSWNPDTDVATVHKLLIRRGDKVIDVLAAGQTFTVVRRETNLENATLDGVLTATIQPEGLQVGDIVDFAATVTRSDPALKDHLEEIGGGWNGAPITSAHMRVQWPSSVHLRVRVAPGLPALKPSHAGGLSSVELSLADLPPLQAPRGAPARYAINRIWEMTDFTSWSDLAQLMAPLYTKAATLPPQSAVRAEVARIASASTDPKTRAEAALSLVQDRVRYVFLGMNDGGLVPADAETTWSRRFGDCKGKTALLLAVLHELGIEAEPVIASIGVGDGIDERLPLIALFNHVLVRATIAGRVYWLDGTRTGDSALDQIRTPNFGWGLPLVPGANLVTMVSPGPDQPPATISIRIDASAGLTVPASFHVEAAWHDDVAVAMSRSFANMTPDVRDSGLRDYWRKQYDFVDVTSVSASFDPAKREERLVMDGGAHMDWNTGWYETDGLGVGYKADFTRDPGLGQDAPFATAYPAYSRTEEIVLLPKDRNFTLNHGEDVDVSVAGVSYHRHTAIEGNRFTGVETERVIEREFPAAEAATDQKTLRALADKTVYIKKPDDYGATPREVDAALLDKPSDASAYLARATTLLDSHRFDEAIADFTSALTRDPKNARALAGRGVGHAWKGETALATADLDAAAVIDPKDVAIFHGRALLAERAKQWPVALDALSKAIALWPQDGFALEHRANLSRYLGNSEQALADAGEVLRHNPQAFGLYLLRASLYRQQGRRDLAASEAAALSKSLPTSDYAQITAAMIYARSGQQAEAMKAFDRAIAIAPSAYAYINRERARPWRDFAVRESDLKAMIASRAVTTVGEALAALKAGPGVSVTPPDANNAVEARLRGDPGSAMALLAKAELQDDQHDYAGAVATLTSLIAASPSDLDALLRRGIDHARLGETTLADADLALVNAAATESVGRAKMCFEKAAAGVLLDSALADCDAALKDIPDDPDYLADRALVLLRRGDAEAVMAYSKVLARRPNEPSALYGRAIAESHKGEAAKAATDRAAALRLDPDTGSEYDRIGVEAATTTGRTSAGAGSGR